MLDLGRTFLQALERDPGHLAFVQHGPDGEAAIALDYQTWAGRIGATQQALAQQGIGRGDRVLSVLQNRFEAATLHWACQMAGVTIVPINWRSKADEIDFCAGNADAKLVFFEPVSADAYFASDTARTLPAVFCAPESGPLPVVDAGMPQALAWSDWLGADAAPQPVAAPADVSVMLYTSGTTGKPKGVPRRQSAERAAAVAHIAQNLYRSHEVTLGVMPLYHTMGVRTLLSLCLVNGTYVAVPRWQPDLAVTLIERYGVTHLYLVPTLYHDMLAARGFAAPRIASVRKLGFAGAPMHDALLLKLQEIFRPELFVNHYGSSEIYTFTINQRAAQKPGSAGRAGLNERIRVVRLDATDRRAGPDDLATVDEEGQIICELSSDEAFEGYWRRDDANEKSLRGGWYFTGDTGYFDAEGELFVTGRVDDMIISGGENISPVEIESVLSLHPAVDEVAVAGLRDERLGQKVVAFVRLRDRADAGALDAHCRASALVNFKRPREYVFVKDIPKSPVGKILRRKLVAGEFELAEPS